VAEKEFPTLAKAANEDVSMSSLRDLSREGLRRKAALYVLDEMVEDVQKNYASVVHEFAKLKNTLLKVR
jgi:hypothetical protein